MNNLPWRSPCLGHIQLDSTHLCSCKRLCYFLWVKITNSPNVHSSCTDGSMYCGPHPWLGYLLMNQAIVQLFLSGRSKRQDAKLSSPTVSLLSQQTVETSKLTSAAAGNDPLRRLCALEWDHRYCRLKSQSFTLRWVLLHVMCNRAKQVSTADLLYKKLLL